MPVVLNLAKTQISMFQNCRQGTGQDPFQQCQIFIPILKTIKTDLCGTGYITSFIIVAETVGGSTSSRFEFSR